MQDSKKLQNETFPDSIRPSFGHESRTEPVVVADRKDGVFEQLVLLFIKFITLFIVHNYYYKSIYSTGI